MIKGTSPVRRIVSPLQPGDMMTLLQQVIQLAPQILSAHAEMKELHKDITGKIAAIKRGPPGPPGYSVPGRDGKDADHKAIAEIVAREIRMPKDGRPGRDGKAPTREEIVQQVLKDITSSKKLSVKHLADFSEGIEQTLAPIRHLAAGFRGGGDTVAAGTGITITTDSSGKKVITAGSSITTVVGEDLSSQAPGTSFTLAHTPTTGSLRLYRGGTRQRSGAGNDYTLSGAVITFATSVASGEVILADYTY